MTRKQYENRRAILRLELKLAETNSELERESRRKRELESLLNDANASIARMAGMAFRFHLKHNDVRDERMWHFETVVDRMMLDEMRMEGRELFIRHMAGRIWVEFMKAELEATRSFNLYSDGDNLDAPGGR